MSQSEIHIVLIWEKGLSKLNHILHDLEGSFEILDVIKINWSQNFFSDNLSRFYGQNLPNKSFKEKHCGKGPFVSIIVRHKKPIYEARLTSKGECVVNSLLFDKKQLYRKWTGGGHRIHTSNDVREAKRDIFLLLNKKIEDYNDYDIWNRGVRILDVNIQGFSGWKSFSHFFNFMNISSEYIVLRNYKNIESIDPFNSDIDFLTKDRDFVYLINGVKKHSDKNRAAYSIQVGDNSYNVDVRFIDDRYYDVNWAHNMIDSRILYNNKFFIPNSDNEFYSLLYHALIHKKTLSKNYYNDLSDLSKILKLNINLSDLTNRERSLSILNDFLNAKGYKITRPKDYSVKYNYGYKGVKRFLWELVGRIKNV
jgi:hypothetical protein